MNGVRSRDEMRNAIDDHTRCPAANELRAERERADQRPPGLREGSDSAPCALAIYGAAFRAANTRLVKASRLAFLTAVETPSIQPRAP